MTILGNLEAKVAETEAQLEEALAQEAGDSKPEDEGESLESEDIVDEALDEAEDEEESEESDEDTEEEQEEEVKLPEDEKSQNRAFADLRRQEAESRREANELRERLAKLEAKMEGAQKSEEPADEEPDRDLYPDEWLAWNQRQNQKEIQTLKSELQEQKESVLRERLYSEWDRIDADASESDDLYKGSKEHLINQRKGQLRALYPDASEVQLDRQIKQEVYQLVEATAQKGIDTLSLIKVEAIKAGFVPHQKQEEKPKSSPKKAAANKRKSASLMGDSGGNTRHKMEVDELANMSLQDKLALTPSQWAEMEE